MRKNWLTEKDPDAARYWGQEEKGTTEDEMADGAGLISGEAAVRIRTAAHQVRRWTERCYRDAINGGDGND